MWWANQQRFGMTLWSGLLDLALELVRADPQHALATDAQVLQRLLRPAHAQAPAPHSNPLDLLYVFAASLGCTGRSRADRRRFARLVRAAAEPFVRDGRLLPLPLRAFAGCCLQVLGASGELLALTPAARAGQLQQLALLAGGRGPLRARCSVVRGVSSVVAFADWLQQHHAGCAAAMHRSFAVPVAGSLPDWSGRLGAEAMEHLPLLRVGVALRFLQDSQTAAFAVVQPQQAARQLDELRLCRAGWLVKPDMHVLRLMLHLTGRAADKHIDHTSLPHLRAGSVAAMQSLYAFACPRLQLSIDSPLHRGRPREERGLWQCIADVQHLAARDGVPPLALDRLLSLIGSGEFEDADQALAVPQWERYARFVLRFPAPADMRPPVRSTGLPPTAQARTLPGDASRDAAHPANTAF